MSSSALLVAWGAPGLAADFQWTGATSTDWYVTTNWSVDGSPPPLPPKSGDNVTINTLNNAPVLTPDRGTEYISNFIVGDTAAGLLTSNATVSGETVTIGSTASGSGTVIISGAGSAIQFDKSIIVGGSGVGVLSMQAGAQGQAGAISLGNAVTTANGTLNLDGAGTQMRTYGTGANSVFIGNEGVGNLNVTNGARFESNGTIIGNIESSNGTVIIAGANSEWNGYGDLILGKSGTGSVVIRDGGHVISGSLSIGQYSSSTGNTATVSGAGSLWNVYNDIAIGGSVTGSGSGGSGELSVLAGATMTGSNMTVGYVTGGEGTATIDGAGTALQLSGALKVGNSGTGTMIASGGAVVTADYAMLGVNATGDGALAIDGAGTDVTLTNRITVAAKGSGQLQISNSGVLNSNGGVIGRDADSEGVAVIIGNGVWNNSSNLTVGDDGIGALGIASGGTVNNKTTVIGSSATSGGAVVVTGVGSAWTVDGAITVGAAGGGVLSVSDAAVVTSTASVVGQSAGSLGIVDIDGGLWAVDGSLTLGEDGNGLLAVADGGGVSASDIVLAANAGSAGVLVIGTTPGAPARAAGNVAAPTVAFGSGTGQIIFNHTSSDYVFAPTISGTGQINAVSGTTILTADNTNSGQTTIGSGAEIQVGAGGTTGALGGNVAVETGGTLSFARADDIEFRGALSGDGALVQKGPGELNLSTDSADFTGSLEAAGGSLDIDADLRGATAEVATGATLGGSGIIGDTHVSTGGTFRAGDDKGAITVDGDLDFDAGATYVAVITINQEPAIVTGTAAFDDTEIDIDFDQGGVLKKEYTLLQAGDITGTYDASLDALPSQFRGSLSEEDNALKLGLAYVGGNFNFSALGQGVNTALVSAFDDGVALEGTLAAGMLQSGQAYEAAMTTLGGELGINATMTATLGMDSFLRRSSNPNRLLAGWRPVEKDADADTVQNAPAATSGLAYWAVGGYDGYAGAAGDPRWDWSAQRRQSVFASLNPINTGWLEYNGGSASVDGDAQAGNSGADIDSNMIEGGYLARLDDANAIGIVFGGGSSTYKQTEQDGTADAQSFHAAINGVTQSKQGLYATAALGGGVDNIDTKRTVAFGNAVDQLRGSYSATTVGGRIEAGGRIVQNGVAIMPFVGASAVYTHAPDYQEEVAAGYGNAALAYSDVGLFRGTVEAGLGFDTAAGDIARRFAINGRVSYLYRYGGGGNASASFLALPGYGFSISSNAPTGSAVAANVAARIQLTAQADLSFGAYGEWGADYSALIASAKLRYIW